MDIAINQTSSDSDHQVNELHGQIPHRIWQTWKTNDIPQKWAISPISIKNKMPGWTYQLMTDEDNRALIAKHFPDFLPTYDGFQYPIQRADAVRYAILYLYGGLYLDLDYEMQHSLESYLTGGDLFFINSSNIGGYLTNSIMASRPRHPIWLEMLEEMKKPPPFYSWGKHLKVINTTGPGMVDRVAKRNNYKYVLLDNTVINPCNICDIGLVYRPEAILRPLEGSSWAGLDTQIYNACYCHWFYILIWIILIGFILFLLLVYFRS